MLSSGEPPNKGMKLTGALPRFARWHGRRPQLIPVFDRRWRGDRMSMIGNFRLSSDDEVRQLLSDPNRITALLYPEPPRVSRRLG